MLPGSRKAAGNPSVEVSWTHRAHDSPCGLRAAESNKATGFGGNERQFQTPRVVDPQTLSGDTNTSPHRFEVVMTTGQFPVGQNCQRGKASRTAEIWCSPTRSARAPIDAKAPGRPGNAPLAVGGQNPFRRTVPATGGCGAFLRPQCVLCDPQTSPRGQFRPVRGGAWDLLTFCPFVPTPRANAKT